MALIEKRLLSSLKYYNITYKLVPRRISQATTVSQESAPKESLSENTPYKSSVEATSKSVYNTNLRFQYQEFLPNPNPQWRNVIREKLEREDMLSRRRNIDIPEFYVGSVLAVTTADKHAVTKTNRFVGICIERDGNGLRAMFTLRNVVDHQGVEVRYDLYSPLLQKIELLRLEKRLDSNLIYLRDAPHEYSTFPFDMEPEYHQPGTPVPVNTIKVKINPRPWLGRYERMNLQGAELPPISEKLERLAKLRAKPWERYDLMDYYRSTVPEEEQRQIYGEVVSTLEELERKRKTTKRRRTIVKPDTQNK